MLTVAPLILEIAALRVNVEPLRLTIAPLILEVAALRLIVAPLMLEVAPLRLTVEVQKLKLGVWNLKRQSDRSMLEFI
jgi:hypothetical protein